jgi:hypothetical protein
MTNNPNVDVNETYGGKTQEQTDYNRAAMRYQNRFETDREPRGHNMGDQDEVKGS